MPDVEILANPEARRVLTARPGKELPQDVYDNLAKRLSAVAGRSEPKGAGFYGVDLNNGYRSIFTFNKDHQPVLVYVGDHAGYEKLSREIAKDADKVRSNFLKETPEKVTISSKKALKSLTFEEFRHSFLQETGKTDVLAKEAKAAAELAENAGRGGRFIKGIKGGAKVGGKVLKVVAVGVVAAEILGLTEKAEAAELDGRLPKGAVDEYKKILAGQGATVLDPTFIGGEIAVQSSYMDWAKKYLNGNAQLEAELRPSSILESLGMPMPTVAEEKRSEFYRSVPDKEAPGMTAEMREFVKAKQEIHKACDALMKQKTSFWGALAQSGGQVPDEALYPAEVKAIDDAQKRFNDLYQRKIEGAAPARPAQSAPGR
jgi:hypothetical protein